MYLIFWSYCKWHLFHFLLCCIERQQIFVYWFWAWELCWILILILIVYLYTLLDFLCIHNIDLCMSILWLTTLLNFLQGIPRWTGICPMSEVKPKAWLRHSRAVPSLLGLLASLHFGHNPPSRVFRMRDVCDVSSHTRGPTALLFLLPSLSFLSLLFPSCSHIPPSPPRDICFNEPGGSPLTGTQVIQHGVPWLSRIICHIA